MRLSGYGVYRIYMALKMHFTQESYDYVKYHGKVRVTEDSYSNRRDKWYFEKLAKKYDADEMETFLLANMKHGDVKWIGDYLDNESREIYNEHKKHNESLSYNFSNEIDLLLKDNEDIRNLFKTETTPPIC
jgi:T4 gene Gp59 loader of gp41 DNA helicase